MIKHINHQNFLTTPFVAAKSWHLYNRNPDDLVILEPTGSEDTVALEYTDYSTDDPFVNVECSIALEQQSGDRINFQEGVTGSGKFFPSSEPINTDGTFKRLVHAQTKQAFYNKYNDPTKIFGLDFIDFPLGQTFRDLSNVIRLFNVPQGIFGERIIENTVVLNDTSMDDNVEVRDDGYQNLVASSNLFSKVQEVRSLGNIIMDGTASFICYDENVYVNVYESGSTTSVGFLFGSLEDIPTVENASFTMAFLTGSLQLGVITSSNADTGSNGIAFLSGYLTENVTTSSATPDSASVSIGYYTGSIFNEVVTGSIVGYGSGSTMLDSASFSMGYYNGVLFDEVEFAGTSSKDSGSFSIGFLSGVLG
jgi:hypothetical protein